MDLRGLSVCLENLYSCSSSAQFRDAVETLAVETLAFTIQGGEYETETKVGDVLEFHNDEHLLNIIDVIIEHRLIAPKTSEWKKETKIENLNVSQRKENELRRKAAVERQKELEEFEKDKKERQELARKIKQQIEDDKKYRRVKGRRIVD